MTPEYVQIGGQSVRVDTCPSCAHTGHDGEPCEASTFTLNLETGERSVPYACKCGHELAPVFEVRYLLVAKSEEDRRRIAVEGSLFVREADVAEADAYWSPDDEGLLDVDFLLPGGSYSASNRAVIGGTNVQLPPGYEFDQAHILWVRARPDMDGEER